ncbi:MAG: methionine aminotransferase [Desulfobacterales bacterium]|nr:methionine aminotransferase [Desulfobacterales bacterium]MDJ0889302.1 methionine aminotransferase [Desulfobacterales bacterium]
MESKLPDVGVTIFTVMSQLAQEAGAINLSQGFPDFDVRPRLIDRVTHHMQAGHNQYAPMQGVPALRAAIAAKVEALYGARHDPEAEITVTSGATEALYAALTVLVRPGDEVIVIEPAYDAYEPAVRLNGGRPVFVPLSFPDYRIDWEAVERCVTPRTRALILNTPHNPTGMVLAAEDIAALEAIVRRHTFFIVSDEVYEHIVFDGRPHLSMVSSAILRDRSFVVSSFGKTYHATGWKVGYCLAPAALTAEFRKIHQYLVFATSTPVQMALADHLATSDDHLTLANFYQGKRDRFRDLLAATRFKPLACHGTYFQMVDYSAVTTEADVDFARRMTTDFGVAAIPPSVFYHDRRDDHVLRFCFAKHDHTLEEAVEKLCRI